MRVFGPFTKEIYRLEGPFAMLADKVVKGYAAVCENLFYSKRPGLSVPAGHYFCTKCNLHLGAGPHIRYRLFYALIYFFRKDSHFNLPFRLFSCVSPSCSMGELFPLPAPFRSFALAEPWASGESQKSGAPCLIFSCLSRPKNYNRIVGTNLRILTFVLC